MMFKELQFFIRCNHFDTNETWTEVSLREPLNQPHHKTTGINSRVVTNCVKWKNYCLVSGVFYCKRCAEIDWKFDTEMKRSIIWEEMCMYIVDWKEYHDNAVSTWLWDSLMNILELIFLIMKFNFRTHLGSYTMFSYWFFFCLHS